MSVRLDMVPSSIPVARRGDGRARSLRFAHPNPLRPGVEREMLFPHACLGKPNNRPRMRKAGGRKRPVSATYQRRGRQGERGTGDQKDDNNELKPSGRPLRGRRIMSDAAARTGTFLLRLSLPDKIRVTSIAGLACAYRTGTVDRAANGYLDWLGLAGPGCSHRQLALRPHRSYERIACGAGILRLAPHDGQRPRSAVRTFAHLSFPRHERLIDSRRRDQPIGPVECRSGGRRRWSLRIRGGKRCDKRDGRKQPNVPPHS